MAATNSTAPALNLEVSTFAELGAERADYDTEIAQIEAELPSIWGEDREGAFDRIEELAHLSARVSHLLAR